MPDARIKEDSTNNNDRKIKRWGIKNKGADEMVSVKRRRRDTETEQQKGSRRRS